MFPKAVVPIRTRLRPIGSKVELTALVDVLFLLLVFFMLSSSFIRVSGTKVELPQTESLASWGVSKCVITIQADGKLYLNDQLTNIEGLKSSLLSLEGRRYSTVVIRADAHAYHKYLAQVLALVSEYGMSPLIATTPIQSKPPAREPVREP